MNQSPVNGGIAAVPKKKVYISGPIAHYDLQERKNTFAKYADMLEQLGYTPVNPFDNPSIVRVGLMPTGANTCARIYACCSTATASSCFPTGGVPRDASWNST